MCITPLLVKTRMGEKVPVPCGKCPKCKGRRTSGWSFRLIKEEESSSSSYFVTLTYDTDNVPITPKGWMTLNKKHVQLFFKKLRRRNPFNKLVYYVCGEYGSQKKRPHYHVILFNVEHVKTIQDSWSYGSVDVGTVTGASVGYTLKYISKPSKIPLHKNDDRLKEFSLMSKGIGKRYITDSMRAWHKADLAGRCYINIGDGKKAGMPRYYKDRIYTEQERQAIGFRFRIDNREKDMKEWTDPRVIQIWRDRAQAHEQLFNQLKRSEQRDSGIF